MNYKTKNKLQTIAFGTLALATLSTIIGANVYYKSDSSSEEYLLEHGFTKPVITGYKWTCAKGTLRTFEFQAIDKSGNEVEGYVCATRLFMDDNITIEKTTSKPKI